MDSVNCFKNQAERDKLLKAQDELEEEYEALIGQKGAKPARRKLMKRKDALRQEYRERLPLQSLSICPFCSEVFKIPMDPFGYDGPWWGSRPFPKGVCSHYAVIREAVNFHGQRLDLGQLGGSGITFGPEVPYVIKRLFKIPTMTCVMSRVDLPCGYTYYPMVYFAESPPHPDELKCGKWAHHYHGSFEEVEDSWLFDFQPFVESGQVRLATVSDTGAKLEPHNPESFPFFDLPGHRGQQLGQGADINFRPPPHPRNSHYAGPSD